MLYTEAVVEFIRYMEITDKSKESIIGYKKELRYMSDFLVKKYNGPLQTKHIGTVPLCL